MNSSYRVDFGKREYKRHAKGAKRIALLFSICSSSVAISIENFHGNGLPQAVVSFYHLVPSELLYLFTPSSGSTLRVLFTLHHCQQICRKLLEGISLYGYSYTALPINVWTELQYTCGMCRATHGVRIDPLSTGKCTSLKFDNITYQLNFFLCFADRASWHDFGQMTNLMHNYVI